MTATTAKISLQGQSLFIDEQALAAINDILLTCLAAKEDYVNGKYVYTPLPDKHLKLVTTLNVECQVIGGEEN